MGVQGPHWRFRPFIGERHYLKFWCFNLSGDLFDFNWGPMLYFLHSHLILQLSDQFWIFCLQRGLRWESRDLFGGSGHSLVKDYLKFWCFNVTGDPFHFNWGPMLYFLHSHLILQLSDYFWIFWLQRGLRWESRDLFGGSGHSLVKDYLKFWCFNVSGHPFHFNWGPMFYFLHSQLILQLGDQFWIFWLQKGFRWESRDLIGGSGHSLVKDYLKFWCFNLSGDPFDFNWGPMLYFLHSHLILQLSDYFSIFWLQRGLRGESRDLFGGSGHSLVKDYLKFWCFNVSGNPFHFNWGTMLNFLDSHFVLQLTDNFWFFGCKQGSQYNCHHSVQSSLIKTIVQN